MDSRRAVERRSVRLSIYHLQLGKNFLLLCRILAVLESIGSPPLEAKPPSSMELTATNTANVTTNAIEVENGSSTVPQTHSSISQILRNRIVHIMGFFILVYVGIEVTIGGWIVSFLVNVRGGGPSSGYVSSGFFGGLTFGRIALLWVNRKVGERRVVFIYAALAIAYVFFYPLPCMRAEPLDFLLLSSLELVVWFVPSLVGNAVAVSFVGVLLGPMYPLGMTLAGRVLPRKILTGSIGKSHKSTSNFVT
jgi:fucose permease